MFNITKFKQIVSPVLLLASILLFNNLTLAAAGGGLRATASRFMYRAFGVLRPAADRALLDAARDGNGNAVAAALAAGADVNIRNNYGETALMRAALNGHVAIVTQLLAAGADLNARDNEGNTPLMGAAFMGHTEVVTQLLAAGTDVNIRDNEGDTALILAVSKGHAAIVTQLLAAGTDVNIRDNEGATALIWAALSGHTAIVTQLLAAGAEIPAELQEHAQILAQPETLRTTPALIRTLNSGYLKQVIKAITHPDIIAILMATDLGTIDFAQHKFIIDPGVEILPDFDLLATGTTRAVGEYGPEITPEEFSVLDLAILSCQPALVDQLLMSGMSPEHLTQQTRNLLAGFSIPDGGAREAKGADDHAMTVGEDATLAESKQIAKMIYYADMAQATEVQNRVRGLPSIYNITEPLPETVERYAKATKKFRAWAKMQIVDLPVAAATQVESANVTAVDTTHSTAVESAAHDNGTAVVSTGSANVTAVDTIHSAAAEPAAHDNSTAVVSTGSASNSYLQRALISGGIALAVVAVAAIARRSR